MRKCQDCRSQPWTWGRVVVDDRSAVAAAGMASLHDVAETERAQETGQVDRLTAWERPPTFPAGTTRRTLRSWRLHTSGRRHPERRQWTPRGELPWKLPGAMMTTWPRDLNTGPSGGLSTGPGGGLSTGPGGGASTGPDGGLSTGPGGGMSTGPGGGLSTGARRRALHRPGRRALDRSPWRLGDWTLRRTRDWTRWRTVHGTEREPLSEQPAAVAAVPAGARGARPPPHRRDDGTRRRPVGP